MPATALTGSLGTLGATLGLLQLGGPPLVSSWTRTLPAAAVPLLGHLYANDGVTANTTTATFPILNRPSLKATIANGGYDKITLQVSAAVAGISQGNVVRLTETGGPFKGFVYSGIVEGLPGTLSSAGTKHEIVLAPFGFELDDTHVTLVYAVATDLGDVVRAAVSATQHCSCDQVSVPAVTGIQLATTSGGQVDFRDQTVKQVLDTCRSIAGATWFWFCDELGRVWFQPMGSSAVYTIPQVAMEERVSNGGDIQHLKNDIPVVGGVPTGGSVNVTARYTGGSQGTYGKRSLSPTLSVPNISDQAALTAIANGVGAVLDRVWHVISVKALPTYAQRIHGSQPGGAMVRTLEPARYPMPESETGAGYAGPYIAQVVEYDGLRQAVQAGDIPVTSQTDVDHMIASLVSRAAANSLVVTAAALNLQQQVLTGTWQSGTGSVSGGISGTLQAALWSLGPQMFQAFDPNGTARLQLGNLLAVGISPAQWGGRANDATGTPIWDSLGVVGLPHLLAEIININATQGTNTSFADVSGAVTASFSLSRQSQVVVFAMGGIAAQGSAGNSAFAGLRVGAVTSTGAPSRVDGNVAGFVPYCLFLRATLAAGSYTAALQAQVSAGNWNVSYADVVVYQFGG